MRLHKLWMQVSKVVDCRADRLSDDTPDVVSTRCLSAPGETTQSLGRLASFRLFVRAVEHVVHAGGAFDERTFAPAPLMMKLTFGQAACAPLSISSTL